MRIKCLSFVHPFLEQFQVIIKDELWNIDENQDFVRPYVYYPNPVQDKLHLQFSPDVTPKQIELHDLQGRLLRIQRDSMESIDVEGLPSGTYTMRVILEDGKSFVDKILKR